MKISFTDEQEEYIASQVQSGDYKNASEVVRDALRLHQVYRRRIIEQLRAEIDEGWEGEISPRSVQDIVKAKLEERQS